MSNIRNIYKGGVWINLSPNKTKLKREYCDLNVFSIVIARLWLQGVSGIVEKVQGYQQYNKKKKIVSNVFFLLMKYTFKWCLNLKALPQ